MDGENPTSKALQLAWQGTHRPADSVHRPAPRRIIIIGTGGTGCRILTHLAPTTSRNTQTLAVDSNQPRLTATAAHCRILIPGACAPADLATATATRRQLDEALSNTDVAIITTALDDKTGATAAHLAAEAAHKRGALTIGVVTEPLQPAQGRPRHHRGTINQLRRTADALMTINSHQLLDATPHLTADEAAAIVTHAVAHTIRTLADALAASNHAPLDPDDYRTILQHGGATLVNPNEPTPANHTTTATHTRLSSPIANPNLVNLTGTLLPVSDAAKPLPTDATPGSDLVPHTISRLSQDTLATRMERELDAKLHVTLLMTKTDHPPRPQRIGRLAPHMFNMEPQGKPDQRLAVDLNLYQMEDF